MIVNPFWFGVGVGALALFGIEVAAVVAYGIHTDRKKGGKKV